MRDERFINKIQKFEIIAIGKWYKGFDNRTTNALYGIFSFTMEWFYVLMTQMILISIILYKDCPGRLQYLICYFVQYVNSNICSFLSKSKTMRKCFNHVFNHENTTSETALIDLKIFKLNKSIIKFIILLSAIAAIPWYILAVSATYAAEKTDDICAIKVGLLYQIWYPFDLYKNWYLVTLVSDKLLFYIVFQTHIYNKITPVSFLIFILGQIKIIQKRLRTLEDTVSRMVKEQNLSYNEAVFKEIVNCLKKHQEIIRFMLLVESACKEIVLVGFFTNALELATYSISLIMQDTIIGFIEVFLVITVIYIQMVIPFYYGNEILIESTAISNVIYYETDWVKFDKNATQLLILMMLRAQKPLGVRLPTIGHMSINLVTRVMKLCYSTIMFIKTVYL